MHAATMPIGSRAGADKPRTEGARPSAKLAQGLAKQPCKAQGRPASTVETRLWLPEHDWVSELSKSPANCAPAFRFPDLVSACVGLVCADACGGPAIFHHLATVQILRDPRVARRRTELWRPQFEQLLQLQRSPANRFPNPRFQLDQLTTACVALVRLRDPQGLSVYRQARLNFQERVGLPP